jgi:hypothetical protein
MQGGRAKDCALDRMAQVVLCNRRRIRPLWALLVARVTCMCASPSAAVRAAATATFKRTVLALLGPRDTEEVGPCAPGYGARSVGPSSAGASGAVPTLLPTPGVPLLLLMFCSFAI